MTNICKKCGEYEPEEHIVRLDFTDEPLCQDCAKGFFGFVVAVKDMYEEELQRRDNE